jgi:hypothetical protein
MSQRLPKRLALFACAAATAATAGCARTAQHTSTADAPRATAADSSRATGASIAARTAGFERRAGFISLYLDPRAGKLYLELPHDSLAALYFVSQATGLGSNPVGIDRGADVTQAVARFVRTGDRVMLVFENTRYRSSDSVANPAHARTVMESFPASTVAALPLVASESGRLLVDATDFFLGDLTNVAPTVEGAGQGKSTVARDRSSFYGPYTKAFPMNTEIDAAITFTIASGNPGPIMRSLLPDPRAFTLRQHVSLLPLPDNGYHPRALDPRVGYFGIDFKDYAAPIQMPLAQHWIERHRLERVNPNDANSAIRNPIVYYIDRGIPEPIRTATKQGVSWWIQAFDDAGLKGAFRVEDLPEGVDPMDARYNVVQWENRNERGWSVGGALADPRTGEMMKGMARLDSHRARTDYNLYAGLMGAAQSAADTAFVLARVRQVSAHEVGHTLGLSHNYIASTYERGSVMDYPPPRASLDAMGNIDLSSAYAVGPGAYDVWAIHWGYGIFPPGSEQDSLRAIVADGLRRGFLYLSDADARPEYASDPRVNLWDDANASLFLQRQMDVRRVAISHFGERNIRPGEPVALLQDRFAPVYFIHRFALGTLARTIGGMEYSNAVVGDGQQESRPIAAAQQRAALHQLLGALTPASLAIPDTVLTLMGPRPDSYEPDTVELFRSRTRPAFDELGAARTLASMVVNDILQPERTARLVQFATRERDPLTLGETIDSLVAATWTRDAHEAPKYAALRRTARRAVLDRMITLAADTTAAQEVRAIIDLRLETLRSVARRNAATGSDDERASWASMARDIGSWLDRHEVPRRTPSLVAPPGDPFGM